MKDYHGDVWKYLDRKGFYICIPTNGSVRNDGCGVMGRGVAYQAAQQFPDLPRLLGFSIEEKGNRVSRLTDQFYTFPVKHYWHEKADKKLIKKSAEELNKIAKEHPDKKYVLPRPGTGNGKLEWKDVKKIIEFLPDNVLVITNEPYNSH